MILVKTYFSVSNVYNDLVRYFNNQPYFERQSSSYKWDTDPTILCYVKQIPGHVFAIVYTLNLQM